MPSINNWSSGTSPQANTWNSVCWSPRHNRFVAVSTNGNNRVMYSNDGINWGLSFAAAAYFWYIVVSSNERFVAIAIYRDNAVMYSSDGINNWQLGTAPKGEWRRACWSPQLNRFVAVGKSSAAVMYSDDGITWSNSGISGAPNYHWLGVCWAAEAEGGIYVAVAEQGKVMISSDGKSWALQTNVINGTWWNVCWSPQLTRFVAVAHEGTSNVMYSSDGSNWTAASGTFACRDVCWSPGAASFMALTPDGYRMISSNGIDWRAMSSSTYGYSTGLSVVWSPGVSRFVSVGYNTVMSALVTNLFIAPTEPRLLTATAGSSQVILNWNIPSSDGGYAILEYIITRNPGNVTTSTGSTATSRTISGLNNGTSYTFSVTARNTIGTSGSSNSVSATPFNSTPSPPSITSVTAGDARVTVTWSAGASNGSTRTGYRIERSENLSNWTNSASASSGETSKLVTGLTNGTAYYFRVVTLSNASDATSSTSSAVTPFTTPSPPTITSVTAGDARVTVNWSAGASNGSTRTGYRIESSENLSDWTNSDNASSGATSTSITGLTNGTAYYFRVVTLSNASDATSSTSSAITPNITPNAPRDLIVTTDNASASLSWSAPVPNEGSAITSYNVISTPLGGTININFAARTATVTNLTNGTAYTYSVTATNIGGTNIVDTSSPSNTVQVTPFTVPSVPTNVRATSRNTQATVSWTTPNNGGRDITSYNIISDPGNFQLTTADGLTTTVTFSGLTNGTAYSFTVLAINIAGPSNASNPSAPIIPIGPPVTNNKIAISNDGKVVALSSSSYSDISKGRVYVYELSYNQVAYNWIPLGLSSEIIVGLSNEDLFGWDLALSNDGRVIAGSSINSDASGINCGQVRLFELSNNELWKQKGSVINGPIANSESGYSISLAGNGNRIAIGAWKDNTNGTNAGAVRVYDFSAAINDWRQQGQTLTGEPESYGGYATALSLDGLTLATGYLNVNNANNIINAGQVKTFNWSGTGWINKGTIQGADISYLYFGRALKFSANGNAIVIGAPGNILREGEGTAWVYRYQSGTTWTQLGQTLLGISGGDDFGSSVAISNDGTIISVGSDNNSSNRGHVRVYAYANNYWIQVSNTLSGKSASSRAGIHALSGDGTTLIQSNNTYNSVYGINKTLTLNSSTTSISGNLIVMGTISVNSLDISTNHVYSTNGYSYKRFGSDISSTVMKEYYSDVTSTRDLKVQIFGNGDIRNINNSYKALSDSRLKENIVTSGPKLEDLLKVRVVDYKLKGSNPYKYIGVLAQELEDVFPNLVTELEPSPKDIEDGNTIKYKAVNYSSFDAILIKSLQEQNAMLKNIEKRIIALEDF